MKGKMGCMLLLILADKFNKMKKLLWISLFISGLASAQQTDTLAVDTMEVEVPDHYFALFVDGGVSFEKSAPESNFFSVYGLGVQYDRFMVSFSRSDLQGTIQSLVVFPNVFELKYRYGGANLGYQFYQKDWLNMIVTAGYYKGDMVWSNTEDGQDFFRDEFDLLKFGLRGEVGAIRYIKPHLSIGYQKMTNLSINRLDQTDFSGLFVAVGIRFGYFNQ